MPENRAAPLDESQPQIAMRTSRIEALCDGIFAVAMTILVLAIVIPNRDRVPPSELPHVLQHLAPQVVIYVLSFVNLGVLWVGQHNQYHFVKGTDRWFIWINIAFLATISFVPLATGLLGQYPTERVALAVYGVTLLAATLLLALQWHYATSHQLVRENLSQEIVRVAFRRIFVSAGAYAVALGCSYLNAYASLALFAAVPIINIFPFRIDRLLRNSALR